MLDRLTSLSEDLLIITPIFIFLLIQTYGVYGNVLPMARDDTVFHYALIKKIAESGFGFPNQFYPSGLHAFIALIYQITHYPIEKLAIIVTVIITSFMPFSLYELAKVITKNKKISLVVAFVSPLFSLFPIRPMVWGGLAFLWGLTFMWQYIALCINNLQQKDIKQSLLVLFLGVGLFWIHSPEFFMAFFFIGIYLVFHIRLVKNIRNILLLLIQVFLILLIQKFLHFREADFILSTIMDGIKIRAVSMEQKFIDLYTYGLAYFLIFFNFNLLILLIAGFVRFKRIIKTLYTQLPWICNKSSWVYPNYRHLNLQNRLVRVYQKEILTVLVYLFVIVFIFVDVVFFGVFQFLYNLFGRFLIFKGF